MKPKHNYKPGPMDNCQTPGYAIDPIIPYIKAEAVWEPAYGEGYLAKALKKHCKLISSLADFFKPTTLDYEWQVTNPPYSLKYQWLERSYELGKRFALLLPGDTLFAARAQKLFKKYGVHVIIPSKRINFKMPNKGWYGQAQFSTAWFLWVFRGDTDIVIDFYDASHWNHKQYVKENYE